MNDLSIIVYLLLIVLIIAVTIAILRWVFRIDYICNRLTAISNNLYELKQKIEQETLKQEQDK